MQLWKGAPNTVRSAIPFSLKPPRPINPETIGRQLSRDGNTQAEQINGGSLKHANEGAEEKILHSKVEWK